MTDNTAVIPVDDIQEKMFLFLSIARRQKFVIIVYQIMLGHMACKHCLCKLCTFRGGYIVNSNIV